MKVTLKALRVNLGLTQQEMAEKLGVNLRTWQNYENFITFPDAKIIDKILKMANVSYDDIIFFKSDYI